MGRPSIPDHNEGAHERLDGACGRVDELAMFHYKGTQVPDWCPPLRVVRVLRVEDAEARPIPFQ